MTRLTKIDRYGHFYTNKANCRNIYSSDGERLQGVFFKNQVLAIDGKAIDKLGILEDIEEELGIELEVLFSALKNGIYYFASDGQLIHDYVWLVNDYVTAGSVVKISFSFKTFLKNQTLLLTDYGKTWAVNKKVLAKGELKNDR